MRIETLSFRTLPTLVLVLTFLSYASYHVTRKTISMVKSVLDPKTAELGLSPWPSPHILRTYVTGWAPFNTPSGTSMLGLITTYQTLASIFLYVNSA
ncbi:putative glycerol-3-phosphate transporter 1 [Platanthera zijinensis]|uniref:Glycerol-3-phosphate transporter 1 n=1 Tax=Platanthera zijinensis TaxID=2320716 RepID=A0AAP0BXQ1_9ASPA